MTSIWTRRSHALPAIVLLIAGCAGAPTPAPATATATPSRALSTDFPGPSSTAIAPTATAVSPATGWHAAPAQPSVTQSQFLDVAWTGTRFVATGGLYAEVGGFIDSTDGETWTHHVDHPTWLPTKLAVGPNGVAAIGAIGEHLASWSSADSVTWQVSQDPFPLPTLGDDTIEITDIVASDHRWLAIGRREAACEIDCGLEFVRSYAWTSTDALRWSRVADQASLKGGGMAAVAHVSGGGFVAAGIASGAPAIWKSPDGGTWSRVPDDTLFHEPSQPGAGALRSGADGVAARDGVVIVVGQAYAQEGCTPGTEPKFCPGARAWWSSDGVKWTRATAESSMDSQVFSVTATPRGFLFVGPSGECASGIWSSADGRFWHCETAPGGFLGFGPYAAAGSDTLDVAVGLTTNPAAPEGLGIGSVWLRSQP